MDDCYNHKITTSNLDTSSEYSNLCSKNKQIDQLKSGILYLVSELELRNIINGRIDVSIQSILETMKKNYLKMKCINVSDAQQIFKVLYSDIKQEYINDLTEIKDKLKFMKIKFNHGYFREEIIYGRLNPLNEFNNTSLYQNYNNESTTLNQLWMNWVM